jgi:hypothetical protein
MVFRVLLPLTTTREQRSGIAPRAVAGAVARAAQRRAGRRVRCLVAWSSDCARCASCMSRHSLK